MGAYRGYNPEFYKRVMAKRRKEKALENARIAAEEREKEARERSARIEKEKAEALRRGEEIARQGAADRENLRIERLNAVQTKTQKASEALADFRKRNGAVIQFDVIPIFDAIQIAKSVLAGETPLDCEQVKNIQLSKYDAKSIVEIVAAESGIPSRYILGPLRKVALTRARHLAMCLVYIMRKDFSTPSIGKIFGRDHTTVLSALNKMKCPRHSFNVTDDVKDEAIKLYRSGVGLQGICSVLPLHWRQVEKIVRDAGGSHG